MNAMKCQKCGNEMKQGDGCWWCLNPNCPDNADENTFLKQQLAAKEAEFQEAGIAWSDVISTLREQLAAMEKERDKWKARHHQASRKNRAKCQSLAWVLNENAAMKDVVKKLATFRFSFHPFDNKNGAYQNDVTQLQKLAKAAITVKENKI